MPNMGTGNMPNMGGMGGAGMGGGTAQTFELYSLETLTIATVTSQEQMTLEITVDEQDISRIQQDMDATITVEALTGQTFPATVNSIGNTGTNEGGSSKFTAKLTLDKTGQMLPGMNASAFLDLDTETDVLSIPVAALAENGTEVVVYTGHDAKKNVLTGPVTVTTGLSDGEYVQILSGISYGDTIYYSYYEAQEESFPPQPGFGF